MAVSTQLISGLSSGLDWRSIIDQLIAIEHRPVDLVEEKKSDYESQLSEWRSFNTKLLTVKTAAGTLSSETSFDVFKASTTSSSSTVDASDLFSVSTSSTASQGIYNITVNQIAQSERISSKNYSDAGTALGLTGEIVVSGSALQIEATDTLSGIKDMINALNSGQNPSNITASIVSYGTDNYHLVLASDDTGEDGLSIVEGAYSGGDNILQELGLISSTTQIKNATSDGAKSDLFSSSNGVVGTLLGLTNATSTTVQINGTGVAIDLSSESLTTIAANIDAVAGVSASVVSETDDDGVTKYRIDVSGTTSFTDNGNVLQTLGILEGTYTTVAEVHTGSVANTTNGSDAIDETTQFDEIFGANVQLNTSFEITGKDHNGDAVSGTFTLDGGAGQALTDEVSVLLNYIDTTVFSGTVTATINSDGKIQLTDTTGGDSQLEMTLVTHNQGAGTLDFGAVSMATEGRSMQLAAGQDAEIDIDGVIVASSSNTVTDLIEGVTMNLVGASDTTTVTLKVERDLDTIMGTIGTFVDAYNDVFSYIHQQQSYDEDEETTGGILFGDGTLSSVKSDLTNTLLETVLNVDSDYSTLGLMGIDLNPIVTGEDYKPQLSIDTDKLKGYLQTNFNDVKSLFVVSGTPDTSSLEYVSLTRDTEAGDYEVNITQAATQSTATSQNGTVGENETITITDDDKVATISISTADSLTDIVNNINSELAMEYTETLIGDQQLYEGVGGGTALSSTTTWDEVYLDAATSAGVATNDVIAFTGTTRSGASVSGSYTVTNAASDKVQGLLSAIETAYGNDVAASLDSSGKLVITDKYEGNSQLSITLDYTDAHSLTFGTSVSTSNSGGQEGRYAIDITASDDGSSHLVLTNNYYGSAYDFTISESAASDANKLWTGGDQTVNNGADVEGTINGEDATGSGQVLTGDDGETNVDGLVIKYTGSSTGVVGNVELTIGVGELFDRTLFNITDSFDGYVAYKQDSLEERVDSLETRIEEMEVRLDQKLEQMIARFVAMERALAAMQSQSSWLASQLDAI